MDYVAQTGIDYEDDYPYEAVLGTCRFDPSKKADVSVSGYTFLDQGEDALKNAVGMNYYM